MPSFKRCDLVKGIASAINVTIKESEILVDEILSTILYIVDEYDVLKILAFGTFYTQSKRMRMGRNPKTGTPAVITPRRVLRLRLADSFSDLLQSYDNG